MKNYHSFVQSVFQIVQNAARNGITHLSTQNDRFSGNIIKLNNKDAANFGSCSYLGLEFDERLKQGSIAATDKYGTQFSSSRAYVSLGLYDQLEDMFSQIFQGNHALVTPTTTLGHIAAIPVLVHDDDAVILDHQVHSSVQGAVNMLKARGIKVDMIRHNNMDMLEAKINELKVHHRKIWYMADGIYSMYGDGAPIKKIHELMDRYEQLHFYVDDAHGMSCFGPNGSGYVLNQAPMHRKQVLAVSLAKAFATGGAVLVFPTKEQYDLVRTCGGPMITSGPMQPGNLGAAIESAKIHLSDEITSLQNDLHENIKFTHLMLKKYGLPVISDASSPVFFVGVSLPKIANSIIKKMVDDGFYLNIGVYPAVPLKNTGIRFTITRLHTFQQIEQMIDRLAYHFEQTLLEEEFEVNKIYKAFKLESPEEKEINDKVDNLLSQNQLNIVHEKSILNVEKDIWNELFEGRGSFDWDGVKLLQDSFSENAEEFNNWKFDYLIIKDLDNKPILATFFTTSKGKDDMLAGASISTMVEEMRKTEGEDFLTSNSIMMGSTLTEGEHLFLDKDHPLWKQAMQKMFELTATLQDEYDANSIMYRDFLHVDDELDEFMLENGFIKSDLPTNNAVTSLEWEDKDQWLESLSYKSRKHVRKFMLRKEHLYDVRIASDPSENQIEHWYNLYLQVKNKSLALNTYTLPYKLFKNLASAPNWEIVELYLKGKSDNAVAVVFNYKSGNTYSAMFIGIDYAYQAEYMCYRQALYQCLKRAKHTGANRLNLGYTAEIEKKKIGASQTATNCYIQLKDHYNQSVISNLTKQTANKKAVMV